MENQERRKVIFSGIQPSGNLTLGNYIGALGNWKLLEDDYDCIYSVVDLHAINCAAGSGAAAPAVPAGASILLACGLDPEKSLILPEPCAGALPAGMGAQLVYIYGRTQPHDQFKDKAARHADNINGGPVRLSGAHGGGYTALPGGSGAGRRGPEQHLELARDIAIRFNNLYTPTFTVPDGYIPKVGAKIMSLQDPARKMSKSDPEGDLISPYSDDPDVIRRKLKRAVTDSLGQIHYDPENQPGVANLMSIYGALKGVDMAQVERDFEGMGYGELKNGRGRCDNRRAQPAAGRVPTHNG